MDYNKRYIQKIEESPNKSRLLLISDFTTRGLDRSVVSWVKFEKRQDNIFCGDKLPLTYPVITDTPEIVSVSDIEIGKCIEYFKDTYMLVAVSGKDIVNGRLYFNGSCIGNFTGIDEADVLCRVFMKYTTSVSSFSEADKIDILEKLIGFMRCKIIVFTRNAMLNANDGRFPKKMAIVNPSLFWGSILFDVWEDEGIPYVEMLSFGNGDNDDIESYYKVVPKNFNDEDILRTNNFNRAFKYCLELLETVEKSEQ